MAWENVSDSTSKSRSLPFSVSFRFWVRSDLGRTKIIGREPTNIDMAFHVEGQPFVILWNTKVAVGRIFRGK